MINWLFRNLAFWKKNNISERGWSLWKKKKKKKKSRKEINEQSLENTTSWSINQGLENE